MLNNDIQSNSISTERERRNMLVSVIVPVYNVASYLDECLESICGQTYRELEIILIDDGSNDGSGEICDRWRDKDSRIRVIHQNNAGVSSARNAGLVACTGELIGFADADDWLEADMMEKLVRCLTENRADAVMCGYVDYPYGPGCPVQKGTDPIAACDFKAAIIPVLRRNGYFTSIWNKLFRREAIFSKDGMILMDRDLSFGEDELWLIQVLSRCDRIAFFPQALYHWRPREGSITRFDGVTEKQMSIFTAKRRAMALLPEEKRIRKLAQSCLFNNCYKLKVQAYCADDQTNYSILSRELRKSRMAWLLSPDPPLLRKCKVMLMGFAMHVHASPKILLYLSQLQKQKYSPEP